jgi:hypothetical protein
MNELIASDFALDPTFNIYEASRDYIEQEERNGMKPTRYLLYGSFLNQEKYGMVLTGMIGEQDKKFLGERIINYG